MRDQVKVLVVVVLIAVLALVVINWRKFNLTKQIESFYYTMNSQIETSTTPVDTWAVLESDEAKYGVSQVDYSSQPDYNLLFEDSAENEKVDMVSDHVVYDDISSSISVARGPVDVEEVINTELADELEFQSAIIGYDNEGEPIVDYDHLDRIRQN